MYNVNGDIRFKTTMPNSSLYDYSDAYIQGRTTITGAGVDTAAGREDEIDKGVLFKNCAPFINCKTEINNTEIDMLKILI